MTRPGIIDTKMHGNDGITAAFVVRGEQTALVETGPKNRVENVLGGLEARGIQTVDWIVVTHIHLDHAGAAGTLAARWPDARIAVHGVGAPHLVDPAKLWTSASRIYGDAMERMWGGIDPIARERIHVLEDGDVIDLGGRRLSAIETPGHARHHHAFLDDATGIMFAGDALGVRLQDVGIVRPATPPPEFHLEDAIASIDRIREIEPTELWLTHFGPAQEGRSPLSVKETCDEAIASLRLWEQWVREARARLDDPEEVTDAVRKQARGALESEVSKADVERMEQTTSYAMNIAGYNRYLDKLEGSG